MEMDGNINDSCQLKSITRCSTGETEMAVLLSQVLLQMWQERYQSTSPVPFPSIFISTQSFLNPTAVSSTQGASRSLAL